MSKLKILVVGATAKTVVTVLEKVVQVNEKSGPFDCILLLGEVANSDEFLSEIKVPVPVFLTNGGVLIDEKVGSKSLGDNVTLLNGFGVYELSNGLKIGYLTGDDQFLQNNEQAITSCFHKQEEDGVDILLTYHWSEAISHLSNPSDSSMGHAAVDKIVKEAKPKYHFSCADSRKFTELSPFQWDESEAITRFLNIAEYGCGAKWAYAFSIEPGSSDDPLKLTDLIKNPYIEKIDKKRSLENTSSNSLPAAKKFRQILPEDCRFCFSNPDIEDHLIISISQHAYITSAKGPLTIPTGKIEFSGHCLIIPIEHIPKVSTEKDSSTTITNTPTFLDIQKYELSLAKMNFEKFEMCTIVFAINSENSIHFHKQVIPIPQYLVGTFLSALERQSHFNNERLTRNANLNFITFSSPEDEKYLKLVNDVHANYLQFTVYEDPLTPPKVYVASFGADERIDLQFGRRVVAFMLRLPKRAKWDSPVCKQTKEEEQYEVRLFQRDFKDYDFTS